MATFSITAATNSLRLSDHEEAARTGTASFTVFNASGQPLRGRVIPAADDEAVKGWLSLVGEAERAFPIAGTEAFEVQVAVPPDAPAGSYQFRLDAVDVARPEETHVRGPVVAFEVGEPKPKKKAFPWWILLVMLGVLALGGLAAFLFWPDGDDAVVVPGGLEGLTTPEAFAILTEAGLTEGEVVELPDDVQPVGRVVSSDPASGEEVDPGTAVSLIVSSGPDAPFLIPDVSGMPLDDARDLLVAAGLTVGTVAERTSPDIPQGQVIQTVPGKDTEVGPDTTTVNLFVSLGPPFMAWGSAGSASGQFNNPAGVAVSRNGIVYVADEGNNRIQSFRSDGTFVRMWGSLGAGPNQLKDPADVTVSQDGDVFVADQGNFRIQKFNSNGALLESIGQQANGGQLGTNAVLGRFSSPVAVSAVTGSVVVVGDILTGVHRFDLGGGDVSLVTGYTPGGVSAAPNGEFLLVNTNGTTIYKLNASGGVLVQRDIRDIEAVGAGGAGKPNLTDIAIDGEGNVYVTDEANDRVLKFDPDVQGLLRWWGTEGSGLGQFRNPRGVAIGRDGFVYVADSGNRRIVRIHPQAPGRGRRRGRAADVGILTEQARRSLDPGIRGRVGPADGR